MENFFVATAIYPDGSSETFEGQLYYLGGRENEEGVAKLKELRRLEKEGVIKTLYVSYES